MACACSKNKNKQINDNQVNGKTDESSYSEKDPDKPVITYGIVDGKVVTTYIAPGVKQIFPNMNSANDSTGVDKVLEDSIKEAKNIGLVGCYLCAKKHVGRAHIFFEEYHMGYPDRIKSMVDTLFDAEGDVASAFKKWQAVQNHLDMAAGELIGTDFDGKELKEEHIELAERIREERLKLEDNPLYKPNFDDLKIRIHLLQKRVEKAQGL